MKETIATIPVMDAFSAQDECPFCYLERAAEEHAISFMMGSAYMEGDIREQTDSTGFCRQHYKKMYDYGNRLGSALILSTHLKKLNEELAQELQNFVPEKSSLLKRIKKTDIKNTSEETPLGIWLSQKEKSCYICNHYQSIYQRYLNTFFHLYRKNSEFREIFNNSKGFCIPHFKDLVEYARHKLNDKEKQDFYPTIFQLMLENMKRVQGDVSWFVDKNDYRNKDKDWGNSADSVQRAMQKCAGGYPADPIFKQKP